MKASKLKYTPNQITLYNIIVIIVDKRRNPLLVSYIDIFAKWITIKIKDAWPYTMMHDPVLANILPIYFVSDFIHMAKAWIIDTILSVCVWSIFS